MIVTLIVLAAGLLSIAATVLSFMPQRTVSTVEPTGIETAPALDDAIAMQRSIRIATLQKRIIGRSNWAFALLSIALLLQIAALAMDHFSRISIASIGIAPAFFVIYAARVMKRRDAQRDLDAYLRNRQPTPTA